MDRCIIICPTMGKACTKSRSGLENARQNCKLIKYIHFHFNYTAQCNVLLRLIVQCKKEKACQTTINGNTLLEKFQHCNEHSTIDKKTNKMNSSSLSCQQGEDSHANQNLFIVEDSFGLSEMA